MAADKRPLPRRDVAQERRSSLARDVIIFQGKLLLDAFKDLLLGPLSLIAAVIDMARPAPRSELLFYKVLEQGKAAERAVDLFSAVRRSSADERHWTVDDMIELVETRLARERSPLQEDAPAADVDQARDVPGKDEA